MSYKEDVNFCSKYKLIDELLEELKEIIIVCQENFYYSQEFQKCAYNKNVKCKSYTFNNKVCLNSKYMKTKQNQKLEIKFLKLF